MKCSKSGFENPEGAKFCNKCANSLEFVCPQYGKVNPPGSKFCNECALRLEEVIEKRTVSKSH